MTYPREAPRNAVPGSGEAEVSMPAASVGAVIVEPLAKSMGHQTWFARNLTAALMEAGVRTVLVTFDGMHDDADLALRDEGCDVRRLLPAAPRWVRGLFCAVTGIAQGTNASPTAVRWRFQLYLYNQLATAVSVIYAARAMREAPHAVCHLLCPPSWLTIHCWQLARRSGARAVATAFAAPRVYRGNMSLLKRLCREGKMRVMVQTEALETAWIEEVGRDAVRTIPMPEGNPVIRKPAEECRRLLGLPPDKPLVTVIGCMTVRKGYVELFQALRGSAKDFRILLIGDTPSWVSPIPESVAEECGWLDHTIHQNRFVTEAMWPLLLGAVDVVALLYRAADASSGILSLCAQYGVPVLATGFGAIGEKVRSEDLGLTVDPGKPEEVRLALGRLLRDGGRFRGRKDGGPAPLAGDPAPLAGDPVPLAGDPVPLAGDPAPLVRRALNWKDAGREHAALYSDLRSGGGAHTQAGCVAGGIHGNS